MGISGNLNTMALAELLGWLAEGDKTGTLRLDNGSFEKRLHFSGGRVISTSSTDPKEYLGHFLVAHGYINETELAKAVEMQESNKMLLGQILTAIGVIGDEDLEYMLQLKSEETIYDLFSWSEGEFTFLDDELPENTPVPIDLSVHRLVMMGTQRVDEWERIRGHIANKDAVPVSVVPLQTEDPRAVAVLDAVNDDRTIAEIAMHTHSSEYHVCRILVDFIESGALKIVRARGLGPSAPPPAEPSEDEEPTSGALLQQAQTLLSQGDLGGAVRHYRAAKSLDPDNHVVLQAIEDGEETIRVQLLEEGIEARAVPKISTEIGDLSQMDLSPDEGFLLSRINGSMDIQTILQITPMPGLESMVALLRLKNAGYLTVD